MTVNRQTEAYGTFTNRPYEEQNGGDRIFLTSVGEGLAPPETGDPRSPLQAENKLFVLGHLWLFHGSPRTSTPTGW